jgi:hypothetical protein
MASVGCGIQVQKIPFDWNDVDCDSLFDPVFERVTEIVDQRQKGCFYLNQEVTVFASRPSIEFLATARKCQAAWCRRFAKVVGAAEFRRQAKSRGIYHRMLGYYGILLIDGIPIPPNSWNRILDGN